ncbi:MAG: S1 RNA-binding domain-containing protein [Candidatus Nanohaloarchaea archaeon]
MEWYKDRPDEGDFVVVEITDVDKNSAYADLEEYDDIRGLIHISEASRSWVQDLTKELSEGEKTVAQVVDTEDTIGLSLKRVNNNQKRETMERWRKEQKAEDFIGDLEEKIDVDSIYEDVVFPLQEELGSSFQGFEISIAEEERLKDFLSDEVVEAIQEVARENIDLKQEKFEGELDVEFYQGDGLERIKEAFEEPGEGVEVKCISAPNYSIEAWGRTQELAKKRMDDAVEKIRSKVEELDGEFEFSKA